MTAIRIFVNGDPREFAHGVTIADVVEREGLMDHRVAVEVEGSVIPRSQWGQHPLHMGERLELVHAVGGG